MPKIQLKLAAVLAALVTLLMLTTGYFAERDLRASGLAQVRTGLHKQALLVAQLVADLPFDSARSAELSRIVQAAGGATRSRITLIASDGTVVADSDVTVASLSKVSNHAQRPEVSAAIAGSVGTATRRSETTARSLFYLAIPRPPSGVDVVRVAVDLDDVALAVSTLRSRLLIAGGVGLAASVVLAFVFSGFLVRPLERIRATVVAITGGELSARVAWTSSDELGEIARAVNRMGEQLELRLREVISEKEQLRTVLTGMEEGVLMLDARGRIVLANRRVRELFGTSGVLEDRTPLEVLRSVELERVLLAAFGAKEPVRREIQIDAPHRCVLAVRAVELPPEVGGGVVAVLDDRTELRRLEVVRRDFVANASHELRTPLTAIRGFAETLAEGDVAEPERRRYLGIILEHARRLGSLVNDLLELSRVESGKLELRIRPLVVASAVDAVLSNLESLFAQRKLSVSRGACDVPHVRADPQALEQILNNLLDNAAKYTEPGGRIDVRAERVGSHVRVCVEDTGIGIPESDRGRIFERFYRVDKARSRALGGTGLGLSIVRHLVEAMGGRVGVESTPGKGSTFHFTLPIAPSAS